MTTNDISILLVDDEEKIVERLARILSSEGYGIDTCVSGEGAVAKCNGKQFDIVITDLNMPGISGFEVMEHINRTTPNTLILVLTGYASVDGAIRAIKLGAYDFIEKPIDATTLKLTLRRAAERVHLHRENVKNLKELESLNEIKNEFLAVVSHDLRSPLSTISGYVNYLLKKGSLTESQEKYLSVIKDIANNLYSLVNELLDFSKIEAGAIQLNKEKTDIIELVTSSINNLTILALDKNNTITFSNDLKDPVAFIDGMKIQQVINNLINNAIKFTENGVINVRVYERDSCVIISVQDTGIGIRKKELARLFKQYTYFHKEGTRGEIGSGLGLIICKRFIELHGGELRAQSRIGKGSTFEFSLPRE